MKKIIGITLGDPGGIGPEVLIKGFKRIKKSKYTIPIVIGDLIVLERNIEYLKEKVKFKKIEKIEEIDERFINVYDCSIIKERDFPIGIDNEICGYASYNYVLKGIELWKERIVEGIVTLPISKKAWDMAGFKYHGHTELLAEKLNEKKYAMVMIAENYRVLLLTTHIPLRRIFENINEEKIIEKVMIGFEFLKKLKIKDPVIGMCGLNPHAGEDGILGNEEIEIIRPTVEKIRRKGIDIVGPLPADTIYRGKFDLIIAIYHDQALIPLKTFYFEKLINFTAGIKMPRVSPGHGTGFDIAYKNRANPESFINAYKFIEFFITK